MTNIDRIPPPTLAAIAALVSPFVPDATPKAIVEALRVVAAGDRPVDPARRRLLTMKEAGAALGVSQFTIRRRIADGTLRGVRVGGEASPWRVPVDAVEAFVAGGGER